MRLIDAFRSCGKNGVVGRLNHDFVVLVRKFNPITGAVIVIIVDDHQIGNWIPSQDDELATDWFVQSQSIHRHTKED